MGWQTEIVLVVRHLINDYDSSTYADERLEELICASAQLLINSLEYSNTYSIDIDKKTISPDPTTTSPKDNVFINLVALKSALVMIGSEIRTESFNAVIVKDGPSQVDMRERAGSLQKLYDKLSSQFETALLQNISSNALGGEAVLSPYTVDSIYPRGWFE